MVQINKQLNTHYHKLTVGVFVTLVAWVGCSNRPAGPYQQRQRSYLTTAFTPSLTITSRGSDTGKQTNKRRQLMPIESYPITLSLGWTEVTVAFGEMLH